MKRLRIEREIAEEGYNAYHSVFSYPPRTGRRGLQDVLEIVQKEVGHPKSEFTLSRFLDESVLEELEQEDFFKKLTSERLRK